MKRIAVVCLILIGSLTTLMVAIGVFAQPASVQPVAVGGVDPLRFVVERDIDLNPFADVALVWALHPNGEQLYFASTSGTIVEVNMVSGAVSEPYTTSMNVRHLLMNADGSRLYALSNPGFMLSGTLTTIDTTTSQVLAAQAIAVPGGNIFDDVAVGPHDRLHIAHYLTLHTLDSETGVVLASVPISVSQQSGFAIEAIPDGQNLFALNTDGLFIHYVISSGFPVEINREATIYQPQELLLTPDESSIHMLGNFIPAGTAVGRFTTTTFELQQMMTATVPHYDIDIDQVSQRLYALEGINGDVDIFDAQTSERLGFHAECRGVFEILSNLEMKIADLQGLKQGRLRVAVITTAKYLAPEMLGQFSKEYPGIELALKVTNRDRIIERMYANEDDLYIMGQAPEGEMELEAYRFAPNPLVVMAPRNHPLLNKEKITLQDISKEPFIIREPGSGIRDATFKLFKDKGLRPNVIMELGDNEAIKHGIVGGLGISILSLHTLTLEGAAGPVAILDVEEFPIMRDWFIVHPKGKELSLAARAFLDFAIRSEPEIRKRILNTWPTLEKYLI